jgi:oxygen-dependent protoporphyrinogen oxidase
MKPVAIIGAGITGLTTAFYLKRSGVPVVVYEASGRVGGVIQSVRRDGYLAEFGPNTLLETSPRITELVRDAGLFGRRLDPDPAASARYLVRNRKPIAMPESPVGFFATSMFSWGAKLALLKEPFVPRRTDGHEECIAEFVIRRLGSEFLDRALDALVAGVYAGDPRKLSVPQAFPKLAQLEARYGSLIKGQILGARERKRRGEVAKDRAPKFSFDEGLQVLPDTLRERLGDAVHLNTPVTKVTEVAGGWRVDFLERGQPASAEHCAVIYCGTAFKLAELKIESRKPVNLSSLSEVRHPPVASVVLGFRRQDVAHPCSGFGVLIPGIERYKILGTIFSSALFPNRAPAGHITLTSYVGGERAPELAAKPPEELYALVRNDLRELLGVNGEPTFRHCAFYPRAIPQYNVGFGRYRELMSEAETRAPGLFLAGHYRDGVSLSDSILSGCKTAERVAKFVQGSPAPQAEAKGAAVALT